MNDDEKSQLQFSFNFETEISIKDIERSRTSADRISKPMSGDEYKQKIRLATERYLKRRELQHATDTNKD